MSKKVNDKIKFILDWQYPNDEIYFDEVQILRKELRAELKALVALVEKENKPKLNGSSYSKVIIDELPKKKLTLTKEMLKNIRNKVSKYMTPDDSL